MSKFINYLQLQSDVFTVPVLASIPSNYNGTIIPFTFSGSDANAFKNPYGVSIFDGKPCKIIGYKFDIVGLPYARLWPETFQYANSPNLFYVAASTSPIATTKAITILNFGEFTDLDLFVNQNTDQNVNTIFSLLYSRFASSYRLSLDLRNLQDVYKGVNAYILVTLKIESTENWSAY